jgi:3',5'-cyclic AMP phosphodiesterase CpdA
MRFVILGDLHYANYSDPAVAAARDRVFEAFFRQVAALQADLVFAIGDTTNRGTLEELRGQDEVAARTGLKLIRITGNHDADSYEKAELAPFFLGDYPSASPDELYTAFDFGGVRFVLLDSSRVKCSSLNWSGYVSDAQLEWLAGQVEQFNAIKSGELQTFDASPDYFVVLTHHPMYGTTTLSKDNWYNIDNSEAVRQVLARLKYGPGLYICGHNHINSIFGPDENNWYYLQAGAPLLCESFRLITVDEGGLNVETVDFDLSDPTLYADFDTTRRKMQPEFTVVERKMVYGKPGRDHSLAISPASASL